MLQDALNVTRLFVEFMTTPRMQAAVVGSGDSPSPSHLKECIQ